MKKFFMLLLAASGFATISNAQNSCATDAVYQRLKQQHPEITAFEQQLDNAIKDGMQHVNLEKFAKLTSGPDTTIYDIPIVIHVIHDYGNEYLNDDDIFTAVSNWATIYRGENSDTSDVIAPFKKYVGNPRIRLHLATIDPNGNPTKGITHHQSYLSYDAGDQSKLDQWSPSSYINIWFINQFSGAEAGAAAYAYYPSAAAYMPYYDGVIGLYSYLNYDKAIPHEIGHVLNLEHPWGNTNAPNVACGDDEVDDTPPTMGHLPTGCTPASLYDVTCATGYYKTYKNISGIDSVVDYPDTTNSQNIMDYTYCQRMFTKGQVERMRLALTNSIAGRSTLYSPANLAKTGALAPMPDLAPIADFSVERGTPYTTDRAFFMCAGDGTQFTFKNRSWNDTITSVSWTFSNDATVPTSSNMNTVNTQFSTPGWVTVSLTATGNNTGSSTTTNTQAVYVADNTSLPAGSVQEFATTADMAKWPMFNYYNNQFKWDWYSGAGYGDGACVRYRSYDDRTSPANKTGTPVGDYDDIVSPAYDLTSVVGTGGEVNLNFYTSGSYKMGTGSSQDSMQILVSTSCGHVWKSITTLKGSDLLNNSSQSSEFIPTSASQWKAQTINIPVAYRSNKVFFKFRYWPGSNGNNLYMDKIQVSPYTTEVNEVFSTPGGIEIYPNPSKGDCKLVFTTASDGRANYIIRDVTGKTIYQKDGNYTPNAHVEEALSARIFPSSGIYFVTVTIANKTITEKLMINN